MVSIYAPLRVADNLEDDYHLLLRTTFRPAREELREKFNGSLDEEGFLVRDIFLQVLPVYERSKPIAELSNTTRGLFGIIADQPYRHQVEAVRRLLQGKSVIVATGTGSGKTEAFLMPIIDWCLKKKGTPGVKAILIYPMNALANNQRDRLREILANGSGVSFGRYTGETQIWSEQRPSDVPKEERWTRPEFWENPPDILLTNYQMLDYMLIRDDGHRIFKNHQIRFIVLDEMHSYRGKLGTDIAFLMRRLKSALKKSNPPSSEPIFVGTSATLQSGQEVVDPKIAVAEFFTKLTGQSIEADAVIVDAPVVPPSVPDNLYIPPIPELTEDDLKSFDPNNSESIAGLASRLVSNPFDGRLDVSDIYARTPLAYHLIEWLRQPDSLQSVAEKWARERNMEYSDVIQREVEAAILIGSALPKDHPLKLRLRTHRLLRGLLPFWRCLNPNCGKLLRNGERECLDCGSKALPLMLCRTCGWDFYAAFEPDDQKGTLTPWLERKSSNQTIFLYEQPLPDEQPEVDSEEESTEDTEEEAEGVEMHYICPQCLSMAKNGSCPSGCSMPLIKFALYRKRGTICPICGSRYGSFDVLTPVSMGVSRALTEITRSLMKHMPEEQRKLLIFCDSRQDAAHQTWFIKSTEDRLWVRRAIYHSLQLNGQSHDWAWLKEQVLKWLIRQGREESPRTRDARERFLKRVEGALLSEFSLFAGVRAGLERLGLVRVRYAMLVESLNEESFAKICEKHDLDITKAQRFIPHLLDLMRTKNALSHEALQEYIYPGQDIAISYNLRVGRGVGKPIVFSPIDQNISSQKSKPYQAYPCWRTGRPASPQLLWQSFLGDKASKDSLNDILEWLKDKQFINLESVGSHERVEGYQVDLNVLEFEAGTTFAQCDVCHRVIANEKPDIPCPRVDGTRAKFCPGKLKHWDGAVAEDDLRALVVVLPELHPISPGEHTSAVQDEERDRIEKGFQERPPKVNAVACTPTLELGINIGDLEVVALRNIPPDPAHYTQRAGRTGRETRMGVVAGFSRALPHDGYFFDHPDEIIAGAINAPRFYSENLTALACHIRGLVLEEANIIFPRNLENYISEEGNPNVTEIEKLVADIRVSLPAGKQRALVVFDDISDVTEEWIDAEIQPFPDKVRKALEQRARAIEKAVERMRFYANKVSRTNQEKQMEEGYRILAQKLRLDRNYSYLPRVFAEAGLLPGYAFPSDPGSLHFGFQPEPVFSSRVQAQREYAPGQVVYARGDRWEVKGVALHRPGGITEGGLEAFSFTLCGSCGLANIDSNNNCLRCGSELANGKEIAWDVGAFRAEQSSTEAEMEESRTTSTYEIRPHPQQDVPVEQYRMEECVLELRKQEGVWWINRGKVQFSPDGRERGFEPFWLCPGCGDKVEPPAGQKSKKKRERHNQFCSETPQKVSIGHRAKADTLRLVVPGIEQQGAAGVQWAWSLVYAIIQGTILEFELDEGDIDGIVLTKRESGVESVLEILWVDTVVGGSGVLQDMADQFPQIASAALRHLEGHDCSSSCYRCLRTYNNQRQHNLLDWRVVLPWLKAVRNTAVVHGETRQPQTEGPEWEEARREGCQSPPELYLLRAMRAAGLPEPTKQLQIADERGQIITIADFAYPDSNLLIYVDGLAFHSSLHSRLHDARITRWLEQHDYHVLRFYATEVLRNPDQCVGDIEKTLS